MLTIGEFSKICEVTTKTLRYYEEIGLIFPAEVNAENGYRYYAIEQLQTMLYINRLKSYNFSLEEIKELMDAEDPKDEKLYMALHRKKREMDQLAKEYQNTADQIEEDLSLIKNGKSIMSYLDTIGVQLVEVPNRYLLSIRCMVQKEEMPEQYRNCFGRLLKRIREEHLTIAAPPMVLFHSDEFSVYGMDTEFAIPIKEYVTGTRDFCPGLCIKTVLQGSYQMLPSVYAKQQEWAKKQGYKVVDALFEQYMVDPSMVESEDELVTEVYLSVKKMV